MCQTICHLSVGNFESNCYTYCKVVYRLHVSNVSLLDSRSHFACQPVCLVSQLSSPSLCLIAPLSYFRHFMVTSLAASQSAGLAIHIFEPVYLCPYQALSPSLPTGCNYVDRGGRYEQARADGEVKKVGLRKTKIRWKREVRTICGRYTDKKDKKGRSKELNMMKKDNVCKMYYFKAISNFSGQNVFLRELMGVKLGEYYKMIQNHSDLKQKCRVFFSFLF